jgi:hypothetical protein
LIRHLTVGVIATALAVGLLMVVVIQPPRLTLLVAGVGGAQLLPACAIATRRSTVTMAAIAVGADIEAATAIPALQGAQNDILSMSRTWHAPAQQALDNSKPFLSP